MSIDIDTKIVRKENGMICEHLQFYDCAFIGEDFYFSRQEKNGLFRGNIRTGECKFLSWFENEDRSIMNNHRAVFFLDGKLFFIPHYGHFMHIVDPETLEQKSIRLSEGHDGEVQFSNTFVDGDHIWIIPSFYYNPMIRFNWKTYESESSDEIWTNIKSFNVEETFLDIFSSCRNDRSFVMALINTNHILFFDIDEKKWDYADLDKDLKIRSITYSDGDYWLTLSDSYDVICMSGQDHGTTRFISEYSDDTKYPYVGITEFDNKLIVLAGYSDRCMLIDKEAGKMKCDPIAYPAELKRINKNYMLFTGTNVTADGNLLLLPRGSNRMLEIGKDLSVLRSVRVWSADSFEHYSELISGRGTIREDGFNSLDLFLTHICNPGQ